MSFGRFILTFADDNGDVYHTTAGEFEQITFKYPDDYDERFSDNAHEIVLRLSKPHTEMRIAEKK